ncbi:MAG: translocation/assembly module TamB domain-containing protein [Pseudomonadota bacterium]
MTQATQGAPDTKTQSVKRKWVRWVIGFLAVILLMFIALLAWVTSTSHGTRTSLELLQGELPQLQLHNARGTWREGISVNRIEWQQAGLQVELLSLDTRLDLACTLRLSVCIDHIRAHQITGRISETPDDDESSSDIALPNISVPVAIRLDQLLVDAITLHTNTDDAPRTIEGLEFSATLIQDSFAIDRLALTIDGIDAELTGSLTLTDTYPLSVTMNANGLPLSASVKQDLRVKVSGSLEKTLFDVETGGGVTARASGHVKPLEKSFPSNVRLSWDAFDWPFDPAEPEPHYAVHAGTAQLSGDLDGYDIEFMGGAAGSNIPEIKGQLFAAGNLDSLTIDELKLDTLDGRVTAEGQVSWAQQIRWSANSRLHDIDTGQFRNDIPGRLNGSVRAEGMLSDAGLAVTLRSATLDGQLQQIPLSLELSARYQSDQTYSLDQFDLAIDENERGIPPTRVTFSGEGTSNNFSSNDVRIESLRGVIEGAGEVDWQNALKWSADATLTDIDPHALRQELAGTLSGQISASGSVANDTWTIVLPNLDISGTIADRPFQLNAKLARHADGQFSVDTATLDSGSNKIRVAGTLEKDWALVGEVSLPEASTLIPDLQGNVNGVFSIDGARDYPTIDLSVDSKNLNWQNVQVGQAKVNGTVKALGTNESVLSLELTDLSLEAVEVARVDASLSGTRSAHQLAIQSVGDISVDTALTGAWNDVTGWLGNVERSAIAAFNQSWTLHDAVELEWNASNQQLKVGAHCWRQEESQACLSEPVVADANGSAAFDIQRFPLHTLSPYLSDQTEIAGAASAKGTVSWQPDALPVSNISLEIVDGAVAVSDPTQETQVTLRYDELNAKIETDIDAIHAEVVLNSDDIGIVDAKVEIQQPGGTGQISGNVSLDQFELATLQPFFSQLENLGGTLSAEAALGGTLSTPDIDGQVRVHNLQIAALNAPITVENGSLSADVKKDRASFEGSWTSNEGRVALNGTANLENPAAPVIETSIEGENIEIRQAPNLVAIITPSLSIDWHDKQLSVNGSVAVPFARIMIKELSSDVTPLSKDVVVVVVDEEDVQDEETGIAVTSDIQIELGQNVRLEGFGLRTGLSGVFNVNQEQNTPLSLVGEIQLYDGVYKAYGQNLQIQRGRILLVGPIEETSLDIDASRKVDAIVAGVRIRGSIRQPELTLFSDPQQTEENTLSYIVLGKPLDKSSGGQANVLAQAALSLGIKGGRGIATSIAEQFGIQDFQVEAVNDGDNSQVQLSGRLSPNLLLKYGVGVLTPENTLTLRYSLTERLYVEAAQSIESALDFFYSLEF